MKTFSHLFSAVLLLSLLLLASASANVIVNGTRVVFPAQNREVTLRLENHGNRPALIQAWVDRGNRHSRPDTATAPFLITPPLFRINANKSQSLRIIYTHADLPQDRESLFWLNVLEIPPKPGAAEVKSKNYLQLAIRSRLKLFLRPPGLVGEPQKAAQELTWKAVATADGYALLAANPTAYYVTLSKVQLTVAGKTYTTKTDMIAPMSSLRLPIKGLDALPKTGITVSYQAINDYGAPTPFKGVLTP